MAHGDDRTNSRPYGQTDSPRFAASNDLRASASNLPYPQQHGSEHMDISQSQSPEGKVNYPPAMSPAAQSSSQTSGMSECVNPAFDRSDIPTYISPELLSHITANVIQQLKAAGLDSLQGQQQLPPLQFGPQSQQPRSALPDLAYYYESSPAAGVASPLQHQNQPSQRQQLPPQQDAPGLMFPYAKAQPTDVKGETPTQSSSRIAGNSDSQSYAKSGHIGGLPSGSKPSSTSRLEDREQLPNEGGSRKLSTEIQQKPSPSNATYTELTTLEKVWGNLFENGRPTDRFGQFLRGIANYLIEELPPRNSIVIIPEKIQQFYKDTSVEPDPYPWRDIFDDDTSYISRLFRDLEVEHHLVQGNPSERPDIPGLTPRGFQQWVTLLVQANPEREYERLQKALLNMPISNPDDKRERFPKEIPRRLFPEVRNLTLKEKIDRCIMKHCDVELSVITDENTWKAARRDRLGSSTNRPIELRQPAPERSHQLYGTSRAATPDDEEEEPLSPRPIERERKPYSAKPGGGKVHNETNSSTRRRADSFSTSPKSKEDFPSFPRYQPEAIDRTHGRVGCGNEQHFKENGRSRSSSRGRDMRGDYRSPENDPFDNDIWSPGVRATGKYHYNSTKSNLPGDMAEESRYYPDLSQDAVNRRLHDSARWHGGERERTGYETSWADEQEYRRNRRNS